MNLASFKKYLVLEICGIVILAALAVIGVKLGKAIRQYAVEKSELQAVMDRKQRLDRRDPYPSKENVTREAENYKDILDSYNELNEMLRAHQIEPQAMQPAEFMPLLENTLRRIKKELTVARVVYPPKCTFGFDRYAGGKPPATADIPRLVQQLKIIDVLCQSLGKVGVAELVSIARDEFETAGRPDAGARVGRGAPPPGAPPSRNGQAEDGELYSTQHFKLVVKAGEAAVFDLLNLLARCPMFAVVTSVELSNAKPLLRDGAPTAAPAAAGSVTEDVANRERRIVLGKERVELKLEVDVHQFAPSLSVNERKKQ